MKKPIGKFYDIMTTEGSNEATILLYGYIGEEYTYGDNGWELSGNTDSDFLKEMERLSAQYARINVRINSYGGEVYHGMPIITAIQRSKAEVHTYIDGLAASMAGVIWLSGKHRHMAKNAMLMLHSASNVCWGTAKDMREVADVLDQFTKTLAISIAESTGETVESITEKYFDYTDHWLTHDEVSAAKWITEDDEYSAEASDMPKAISSMKYAEIIAYFKEKEGPKNLSIMQQVKAAFADIRAAFIPPTVEQPVIPSPTNNIEMNFEEFKTSLSDGKLTVEEVKAHLDSLETKTASAPVVADEDPEIKNLKAELKALTETVKAFGAQASGGKSTPGMPATDLPTSDIAATSAPLDAFNQGILDAALAETNPYGRKG